ncbi:MAG: aryl-sulfate sulfotransferase [Candidatus Thorarchaeota archaeon]
MISVKQISLGIVVFCIVSLALPFNLASSSMAVTTAHNWFQVSADAPVNATHINVIESAINATYDTDDAFEALNLVTLQVFPTYELGSGNRQDAELVIDMDGNVLNAYQQVGRAGQLQMINSTTVFFADADTGNFTLWNIYTNETEHTKAPAGHHDAEYNPETETFMVIEGMFVQGDYNWSGDVQPIGDDDIVEYDKDGNEIWRWHCNETFPFDENEWLQRNESRRGEIDWTHSNAVYWDIEDNAVYVSVRHLDCIVKIDYLTAETAWVAGRYTGNGPALTMYNLEGEEVDTLYYHTHAVELIAPNTLLLFDNDFWNLTRPNPEIGISGYVEFTFDETDMTANETWTWRAPEEYYANSQGETTILPNGNVLGAFNLRPRPIVTEVNRDGEIVWEWIFEPTDLGAHTFGWGVSANGIMRFLEAPRIVVDDSSAGAALDISVWEVTQFRWTTNGTVRIFENSVLLMEEDFEFLPHWQETELSLVIPGLASGEHQLTIEVENEDGVVGSVDITVQVADYTIFYVAIAGVAIVLVIVIVIYVKRK